MLLCKQSIGQYFLNGSFENNLAIANQNYITNHQYDSLMSNSISFGFGSTRVLKFPDSLNQCGNGAQNGNWYIALSHWPFNADSISLKLSSPLIAGYRYTLSFYDQMCSITVSGRTYIGVSTINNSFGTLVYGKNLYSSYDSIWTKRTFSFIAPFNAQFITFYCFPTVIPTYIYFDNFTIDSCIMNLNIGSDTTLCQGASLLLNANTPFSNYLWQNNSIDSVFTVTQPGTYWVKVINACGSIIDTIHVAFVAPVSLHINDTSFCEGNTCLINATNSSYTKYLWNTGDTTPLITVHNSGLYIVTASNNTCKITDTVHVSTYLPPSLNILHDTILCEGNSLTINATNNTYNTYLWNTGETTPQITVTQTGKYIVTASIGNCITKDTTQLTIQNCTYHLYIPNAFTPNNDSLNDVFKSYGTGVEEFEMHIYNRLSDEIFSTNDMNIGWDGTFKNNPCMADTYFWVVTYRLKNESSSHTDKGTVTLLK
jgi:gliding motility-associated-like protein